MKAEMSASVKEEIMFGLQKLLALQLERSPALETLDKTGLVWLEAIGHNRCLTDEDAPRFSALQELAVACSAAGGVAGAPAVACLAGAGNQPGAARGKSRLPGRPACWDTDARE